jgi:hypothetical protein
MGGQRIDRRGPASSRGRAWRWVAVGLGVVLVAAGCSPLRDVRVLSSDEMAGRDNGTAGSALARDYIVDRLRDFSVGLDGSQDGDAAFLQPFDRGTNVLGLIPGRELPDEYVIVGAHYDHTGSWCEGVSDADRICNGATDNATGVATVLAVGEHLARLHGGPRRSVVLALWDAEEDGLLGSRAYVNAPLVPIAQTVAYVNVDIQGANLLPSLRDTTFAIAAETGGDRLVDAVAAATGGGPLDTLMLTSTFGEARGDYANFIRARVPTVFFGDSTGPCYHHAEDDIDAVDPLKLRRQIDNVTRLTVDLAQGDERPTYTASTALATFEDALALQVVARRAVADLARFTPDQQWRLLASRDAIDRAVASGPEEFGQDDVFAVLTAALNSLSIFTTGPCDSFAGPPRS